MVRRVDDGVRSPAYRRESDGVVAAFCESGFNGLHADGVSELFFLFGDTWICFIRLGRGFELAQCGAPKSILGGDDEFDDGIRVGIYGFTFRSGGKPALLSCV